MSLETVLEKHFLWHGRETCLVVKVLDIDLGISLIFPLRLWNSQLIHLYLSSSESSHHLVLFWEHCNVCENCCLFPVIERDINPL